jgi:alkylation response protein AidB-like acyl-CoA dehydrogenase
MPIAISPEHNDLADSVRSLVARVAPSDVLHEALERPIPNPPPYWKAAAEQGLQGVHLSEAVGGQGFGILELAIVIAEFGYGAVPGPFVPSAIASALISAHDPEAKLLNDLASGEVIAAYAIDSGLTATRQGDSLVIRGEVRAVPAAGQASVLVLPVAIDSGEEWVVLDADQLEVEPVKSVDPLRPVAHVRANAVEVGDDRVLSNLSRVLARALMSTLLSAESIGVAGWATDTASAYAKIREQFGRPIGQFQAIKHKCAEMIADTERATAAVWDAARAIDEARESGSEDSAFEFAAAVAATLAPVAAQRCAQDCIQVHGGIGFTWEHDTNIYYRRALVLAACFGRAADYPQQVVDIATSTGMRKLDIDLDPETEKLREEIRAEVAGLKAIPREERNTAIAEGGWVQPHLPKPWGRASDPVEQIIIAQEFASGRVKRPQMGIAAWIIPSIVAFGTDEQQQRFLPPTFRGEMIWCQLFSEPGAGSDLAGLSTKATKVDGGWRITARGSGPPRRSTRSGGAAGADGPGRAQTQRHHVLPARHEERGSRGEAAARTHRQRDVQHRLHRRCVRSRRVRARRGEPGLGDQPQHPDRRAGVDRQQRAPGHGQPGRFRGVHQGRPVRPDRSEPRRAADRRGACRQGAQRALDAADAGRWRPDAAAAISSCCRCAPVRATPSSRCPRSAPTARSATPGSCSENGRVSAVQPGHHDLRSTTEVQLNIIAERLLGLPRDP